jgi:O-antigen ligase
LNREEKQLQKTWKYARIGLLIFPCFPTFGALILLVATVIAWKQNCSQIISKPVNIALAILSIWLIFIALFAGDRLEAFLGLANFLPFFLFFAAFNTIIKTTEKLRELSWAIVIGSVPVLIIGLGQQFLNWSTPPQLHFLLGWVLEAGGNPAGRMASVFIYANILAIYLVIVLVLTLGLWLEEWQLFKSKFPQNPQFILLTFVLLSSSIAIIFTHSRNAWGLTIFAVVAYGIYLGWYWLIGLVAAAVASVFGAAFGSPPGRGWLRAIVPVYFWGRLSDRYFPNRPIPSLRITQWQFAWNLTRERPLTGWGLRNFTPLYEAQMDFWLGHPHNLVLMLACETGLPATLFFCGWVGWILARGCLLLFDPPRPPLRRGEEEASRPPLRRGEEEASRPPLKRGEEEASRPPLKRGEEEASRPPLKRGKEEASRPPLRRGKEEASRPPLRRGEKIGESSAGPPLSKGGGGGIDEGENRCPYPPPTTHPRSSLQNPLPNSSDRLIFFSYLVAFGGCILFNMFDVTLFDLRVNTISWLLLAAICGIGCGEKSDRF